MLILSFLAPLCHLAAELFKCRLVRCRRQRRRRRQLLRGGRANLRNASVTFSQPVIFPPIYMELSSGPPFTSPQGFYARPHLGNINSNPYRTGVGRTDHQIGPLEVSVTTGSTTSVVSTVSYHLTSLSSNPVTSFSVPGYRCSGLTPNMSANPNVSVKALPPPMGQVEAALDVLHGAGYPLPDYALPVN